jgi:MHS family proline/betaine transporter-like MFS transporter
VNPPENESGYFSAVAFIALLKMRESAARPLLGSVPVVASHEEAAALAEGQDTDERLDTSTMLLSPVRAETVGAGAR